MRRERSHLRLRGLAQIAVVVTSLGCGFPGKWAAQGRCVAAIAPSTQVVIVDYISLDGELRSM